jgi:hypothetical protein
MRISALILSLIILCLAVYPCGDADTCIDEQRSGTANVSDTDHDHSSREQDNCTPFCVCSCCATHIQLPLDFTLSFHPAEHNTRVLTAYLDRPLLMDGLSIWQPPRSV